MLLTVFCMQYKKYTLYLAKQYDATTKDIAVMKKHIEKWHTFFRKYLPIKLFTINQRYFIHAVDCI